MDPDQIVLEETRQRPKVAVAAAVSAMLLVSTFVALSLVERNAKHPKDSDRALKERLLLYAHHVPTEIAFNLMLSIGTVLMAVPLYYLAQAAKARNPRMPSVARYLAVLGPVAFAVGSFASTVYLSIKGRSYLHGDGLYKSRPGAKGPFAYDIVHATPFVVISIVLVIGTVAIAGAFAIVAMNAMRVGLLSRFLGYIGIIAGVLIVLPIAPATVIQGFWLMSVAWMLFGRTKAGLPPAWITGKAEPWPSMQQAREEAVAAGGETSPAPRPSLFGGLGRRAAPPEPEPAPAPAAKPAPHPSSKKRKRKRRG